MELAGAGGKWKTLDEVKDPSAIRQEDDISCGAACGKMLLQQKGVVVEQQQIIALAGSPTWAEQLAYAMNQLGKDGSGHWKGGYLTIPRAAPRQIFLSLCTTGPWIAELREPLKKIGHFVVVDGIDGKGEKPLIRDPWDGTSYKMELEVFLNYWTQQGIFWRKG